MLQSLVAPVLPTLQTGLGTSHSAVTWVLTINLLASSIFTPIVGRVGDAIGKERVYLGALLVLGVGAALAAVAGNLAVMLVARVIQGVGGGVVPLSFSIIRDTFPAGQVAAGVGGIASITAVGSTAGIVLAGPIADSLDYHWLFWFALLLVLIAAAAALACLPRERRRSPDRISWASASLLSAWLLLFLLALAEAPFWGWDSWRVLVLLAGAVVAAYGWVIAEQRALSPLIDLRMMRQRAVWSCNLVVLLVGVGMYAVFGFLPQFVQTPRAAGYGFGVGLSQAGLILLPSAIATFIVGVAAGRLTRAFGTRVLMMFGCSCCATSAWLIAFSHTQLWTLYLSQAFMGAGFGLAFATVSSVIVAVVPMNQTGVASGMSANIRTIGGAVGTASMATVLASTYRSDGLPSEAGYTFGFAMLGTALAVGAVVAYFTPRGRPSQEALVLERAA